ncbi:hypothetical protein BJV82DRAFT_670939 [Fennellomyces sp. T-0311]|nr:hypothetical protein BJV82DRAFT_670939 [Fennellomyces sp. T-0311]
MFAKSKRFQEGTKEYVPGPGEYNIPTADELSKHKRYGFLNQGSRFNSGDGPVEISADFFAGDSSTASLSSETRFSVSTSSNKTEDARTRRQIGEIASQFEKYRHSMQKEIESLHLKNRKLESSLQSTMLDKETAQATVLRKDQELAAMRMENMNLQKSLGRLEKNIDKSPKVIRLQKRLDHLEHELKDANDALINAQQAADDEQQRLAAINMQKDETILELTDRIDKQSETIHQLQSTITEKNEHLQQVRDDDQRIIDGLQSKLEETIRNLTAAHETLDQKEQQAVALNGEIAQQQQELNDMCTQKIALQTEIADLNEKHQDEREEWNTNRKELEHEIEHLQQQLQERAAEITGLGAQLAEGNRELSELQQKAKEQYEQLRSKDGIIQSLHVRFDTYNTHVTKVMHEMRVRMKSKHPQRDREVDRLTRELREAKKFINMQAQQLDGLKSELHWMSRWNRQLNQLIEAIHQDDLAQGFITEYQSTDSDRGDEQAKDAAVPKNDSGFGTTPKEP